MRHVNGCFILQDLLFLLENLPSRIRVLQARVQYRIAASHVRGGIASHR
jgi:hypothetical protein